MKTFFTQEERERLSKKHLEKGKYVLGVFQSIEQAKLEQILGKFQEDCEEALDHIDITLAHLNAARRERLEAPKTRQKLLDILEKWTSFTQIDLEGSVPFLQLELGLRTEGVEKEDFEKKLDDAAGKIILGERYQALQDKFPYLLTGIQISHLLTLDQKGLVTIKPQFEFMDSLTLNSIAKGKIDYKAMRELTQYHTPFTASFLTMQDMRYTPLPDNHSYFPIVNTNFPGTRRFDFKGVVEVIPDDLFAEIASIDPRVYTFGVEGVRFKNYITAAIMGVKNGTTMAKNLCQLVKTGNFSSLSLNMEKNQLMNIGMFMQDRELVSALTNADSEEEINKQVNMIFNSRQTVYDVLKKAAAKNYMPITHSSLEDAVRELLSPGFLVSFRYARKEKGYEKPGDAPRQSNPGLIAIDINEQLSMIAPAITLYLESLKKDFDRIIKQGTRLIPNGGRFYHQNKDFFEKYKADPESLDFKQVFDIAQAIMGQMRDKDFLEFGNEAIGAVNNLSDSLMQGFASPEQMHYLSLRSSPKVLIEEMNSINPGDLLIGYSNNNCLRVKDIMRYHMSEDARLHAFWFNGYKLGMSYDLMVSSPLSPQKHPLIDSIELSDVFFTELSKKYQGIDSAKVPDNSFAHMLVNVYLLTRAQQSEKGIYIVPESNNYHVRTAMQGFINHFKGQRVLSYQGLAVETDTDFRRMPYWIDRNQVTKTTIGGVIDEHGRITDPSQINDSIPSILSPEAAGLLKQQYERAINGRAIR